MHDLFPQYLFSQNNRYSYICFKNDCVSKSNNIIFLNLAALDIIILLINPPSLVVASLEVGDLIRNAIPKVAKAIQRVKASLQPSTLPRPICGIQPPKVQKGKFLSGDKNSNLNDSIHHDVEPPRVQEILTWKKIHPTSNKNT